MRSHLVQVLLVLFCALAVLSRRQAVANEERTLANQIDLLEMGEVGRRAESRSEKAVTGDAKSERRDGSGAVAKMLRSQMEVRSGPDALRGSVQSMRRASAIESYGELVLETFRLGLRDEAELLAEIEQVAADGFSFDSDGIAEFFLFSAIESDELMQRKIELALRDSDGWSLESMSFGLWLNRSPEAATAWLKESMDSGILAEEESESESFYKEYLTYLAETDSGLFDEMVRDLSVADQDRHRVSVFDALASKDLSSARQLLGQIADEGRREMALSRLTWSSDEDNLTERAEIIREFAPSSEQRTKLLSEMAMSGYHGAGDISERLRWLRAEVPDIGVEDIVEASLGNGWWRQSQLEQLAQSGALRSEPKLRDSLISGLTMNHGSERARREVLVELISQMSDPTLQAEALDGLRDRVSNFQDQQLELERMITASGLSSVGGSGE